MENLEKKINDVILSYPTPGTGFFGGFNGVDSHILIPMGNWDPYLVIFEKQSSLYFDTWNCVAESATNVIEILFKYWIINNLLTQDDLNWLEEKGYYNRAKNEINFSARFVGALAGTQVGIGNSGQKVASIIMVHGLIPESRYDFDMDLRDPQINNPAVYYQYPPQELIDLGKEFLSRFKIDAEPVWKKDFQEALKYSPIQVFVNAWYKNFDGLYYNPNENINHAVALKKQDIAQIFDTYIPAEKGLTSDYYYWPTGYVYTITKQLIDKPMTLKENHLYLLVEGKEMLPAVAVKKGAETLFMLGSWENIQKIWYGLTKGDTAGKVISVNMADWNSVDHYNTKAELIRKA